MTAAHCGSRVYSDVVVGDHVISNASDGIIHETCRYRDHPKYQWASRTPKYDFSILHLKKPVKIGPSAIPACLPTSKLGGDFLAGKTMTTSGWGVTLNDAEDKNKLRLVKVPGITNTECEQLYNADPLDNAPILPVELCAGDTDVGGIDSCVGDSGGNI